MRALLRRVRLAAALGLAAALAACVQIQVGHDGVPGPGLEVDADGFAWRFAPAQCPPASDVAKPLEPRP